jgi:hypothetical protein
MAKDLVRTRNYITRFIEMKTHLNAVSLKIQTIKSHQAMAEAMKGVRLICVFWVVVYCAVRSMRTS